MSELADEAAKLLDAVQEWLRREPAAEHLAAGAPECTWCPLCQLVAVLRGERPEITEKVASLLDALRSTLDAATAQPPRQPRVQHIDLGEA